MHTPFDLTSPRGRAAFLGERHFADLVRRAPGIHPSPLTRDTAEDAVQEVLQRLAAPGSHAPSRPDELYAWAIVAVRRTNARLVRDQIAAPLPDAASDRRRDEAVDVVSELVAHDEAMDALRVALDHLTDGATRQVALLHAFGYARDEIVHRLAVTPRQVRRSIERFHHALAEHERHGAR